MNPSISSAVPPPSLAVLVASCDKYADLWPLFFELLEKFWPDCPYRLYLLTNHLPCPRANVTAVPVGDDTSWSSNLRRALRAIPEDHILLLLDDLFLVAPVDTSAVGELSKELFSAGGNCLKMIPTVPGDARFNDRLDLSSPGAAYRASTVLTLWRKSVLHDLLVDGETAWDFEIMGSRRSDAYDRFFVSRRSPFQMVNGVIKGRWSRDALARVQAAAGRPVTPTRPVLSAPRDFLYQLALARSRLLYRLPPGWGRTTLDCLRRLRDRFRHRASSPAPRR